MKLAGVSMGRGFVLGGLLGSFEPAHRRPMILYQLPELARLAVGAKLHQGLAWNS